MLQSRPQYQFLFYFIISHIECFLFFYFISINNYLPEVLLRLRIMMFRHNRFSWAMYDPTFQTSTYNNDTPAVWTVKYLFWSIK